MITILINGKIFTSDTIQPWVHALIRLERIHAVGNTPAIKALADAHTRAIDLGWQL